MLHCDKPPPHLRLVNCGGGFLVRLAFAPLYALLFEFCGAAPLFGTKIPPLSALFVSTDSLIIPITPITPCRQFPHIDSNGPNGPKPTKYRKPRDCAHPCQTVKVELLKTKRLPLSGNLFVFSTQPCPLWLAIGGKPRGPRPSSGGATGWCARWGRGVSGRR